MTMPQMTGDQLARQVWEIRPDLPVILCTGYNEMISEDKANAMGIRKFLLKPVDKEELAVAIRNALDANGTPPYLVPGTPMPRWRRSEALTPGPVFISRTDNAAIL